MGIVRDITDEGKSFPPGNSSASDEQQLRFSLSRHFKRLLTFGADDTLFEILFSRNQSPISAVDGAAPCSTPPVELFCLFLRTFCGILALPTSI